MSAKKPGLLINLPSVFMAEAVAHVISRRSDGSLHDADALGVRCDVQVQRALPMLSKHAQAGASTEMRRRYQP